MPAVACVASWDLSPPEGALSIAWAAVAERGSQPDENVIGRCVLGALPGNLAGWRRACELASVPEQRCGVALDGRLDGLEGSANGLSPGAYVLAEFARLGGRFADALRGDFAAIVWDDATGELWLARDALGVRPLYWRRTNDGVAAATDPAQLLALGGRSRLDAAGLAGYLAGHFSDVEATFHRDIRRVPPGSVVAIRRSGVEIRRYWQPRLASRNARMSPDAAAEGYRDALRRAVERRLGAGPAVLHLSGGLDSSAICLLADPAAGSFSYSELLPGAEHDDAAIAAVQERLAIGGEAVRGGAAPDGDLGPRFAASPHRMAVPGGSTADMRLARERGAVTILSGIGGDELCFERGVFEDLGAAGRWLKLLQQVSAFEQVPAQRRWDALRRGLAAGWPGALVRRLGVGGRSQPADPPEWAAPALSAALRQPTVPAPVKGGDDSFAAWSNLAYLTHPRLLETLETSERHAAWFGAEYAYPYLDRDLIEYFLGLPYDCRLPGGVAKGFPRRALDAILPREIASPRRPPDLSGFVQEAFARTRPWIESILSGKDWASGEWVIQSSAQRLLDEATWRRGAEVWRTAWKIAIVELWLRETSGAEWT